MNEQYEKRILQLLQGGIGVGVPFLHGGNVFFVDGLNGNNLNDGLSPDSPWLTITFALTRCVADNDDIIVVIDCWQQEPAWPVAVNVNRVHIIGVDVENGKYPRMAPPADTAVFNMACEYFEIAGFSLGAGATHAPIEFNASLGRGRIHHCWLGYTEAAQDGIRIAALVDAPELLIEDCVFGALLTRDGIRLDGNSTRTIIRNNLIRRVPGIGIHCRTNGSDIAAITGNSIMIALGAAAGAAITLLLGVGNALISGNIVAEDGANPGNNPYRDLSTGVAGTNLNAWGPNYSGIALTFPVFV